jgi:hypothetical protein
MSAIMPGSVWYSANAASVIFGRAPSASANSSRSKPVVGPYLEECRSGAPLQRRRSEMRGFPPGVPRPVAHAVMVSACCPVGLEPRQRRRVKTRHRGADRRGLTLRQWHDWLLSVYGQMAQEADANAPSDIGRLPNGRRPASRQEPPRRTQPSSGASSNRRPAPRKSSRTATLRAYMSPRATAGDSMQSAT